MKEYRLNEETWNLIMLALNKAPYELVISALNKISAEAKLVILKSKTEITNEQETTDGQTIQQE